MALEAARHVYPNLTAPLPPPDGTADSSANFGVHEGDTRLRMIARAGRHWKKTQTRRVDQESMSLLLPSSLSAGIDTPKLINYSSVYVYRLCLEWARLWSEKRESMNYMG